jgi:heme/copper-type cytochrome/quinol oxidase subunit 2
VDVNRGDEVTIELVATDVVHGLYLDGYELEMRAEPGQTVRLTFVADRAGTFASLLRLLRRHAPLHDR